MTPRYLWSLLTLKPADWSWRRWLRLNRRVARIQRDRRRALREAR